MSTAKKAREPAAGGGDKMKPTRGLRPSLEIAGEAPIHSPPANGGAEDLPLRYTAARDGIGSASLSAMT